MYERFVGAAVFGEFLSGGIVMLRSRTVLDLLFVEDMVRKSHDGSEY